MLRDAQLGKYTTRSPPDEAADGDQRAARGIDGVHCGTRSPDRRRAPPVSAVIACVPTRAVHRVRDLEPQANRGRRPAEAPADARADLRGQRADLLAAQRLDQLAGLDADRAHGRAQPARGAGVDAGVVVEGAQLAVGLAGRVAPRDLAPAGDALARRQREPGRRAQRLAEAALDALVDDARAPAAAASGGAGAPRGSSLRMTPGLSRPCGIEAAA